MDGTALVRAPSRRLAEGVVTDIGRTPVDVALARAQHAAYAEALAASGWMIQQAPAADDCPDSVFIEDTVVVCQDLAVLARPGAPARRAEVAGVAGIIRSLGLRTAPIQEPGTLDGGDVLQAGHTVYVGRGGSWWTSANSRNSKGASPASACCCPDGRAGRPCGGQQADLTERVRLSRSSTLDHQVARARSARHCRCEYPARRPQRPHDRRNYRRPWEVGHAVRRDQPSAGDRGRVGACFRPPRSGAQRNAAAAESGIPGLPHDRDLADDIGTAQREKAGAARFRVISQVPPRLRLAVPDPVEEEPDGPTRNYPRASKYTLIACDLLADRTGEAAEEGTQ